MKTEQILRRVRAALEAAEGLSTEELERIGREIRMEREVGLRLPSPSGDVPETAQYLFTAKKGANIYVTSQGHVIPDSNACETDDLHTERVINGLIATYGLTQGSIARECCVAPNTVYQWVHGLRQMKPPVLKLLWYHLCTIHKAPQTDPDSELAAPRIQDNDSSELA